MLPQFAGKAGMLADGGGMVLVLVAWAGVGYVGYRVVYLLWRPPLAAWHPPRPLVCAPWAGGVYVGACCMTLWVGAGIHGAGVVGGQFLI